MSRLLANKVTGSKANNNVLQNITTNTNTNNNISPSSLFGANCVFNNCTFNLNSSSNVEPKKRKRVFIEDDDDF